MSNVTLCNDKCIIETIVNTGESRKTIEEALDFQSKFIAEKIREGGFESVRVAHFGIFKAKLKELQWRNYYRTLPKTTTSKRKR
jgi:hypothetical protein